MGEVDPVLDTTKAPEKLAAERYWRSSCRR